MELKDNVKAWGSWSPPVDIRIGPQSLRILVEIPGVDVSSLNLRIEGRDLILEGRKLPPPAKKVLHTEREYGDFFLMIKLTDDVVPGSVEASLRAGVLEITFSRVNKTVKIHVEEENE